MEERKTKLEAKINSKKMKMDSGFFYEKFLISSKPYIRKNNVTIDKGLNQCWEIHYRYHEYDLFVSVVRRFYIPPLMDSFVDIKVATMYYHHLEYIEEECDGHKYEANVGKQKKFKESISVRTQLKNANLSNQHSITHLKNTHRKIIDSIH